MLHFLHKETLLTSRQEMTVQVILKLYDDQY